MFKRRLATLGAVAVLAISGLAGSAMADQTPTPTSATSAAAVAGAKVICKTPDGKTVELKHALPMAATKDGKVRQLDPAEIEELKKAKDAGPVEGAGKTEAFKKLTDGKGMEVKDFVKGEGVQIRKIEGGEGVEIRKLERGDAGEAGEWGKAKPAERAELSDAAPFGKPQKTVALTCEKVG
ncbi:hypothetical protein ABZ897_20580 [Nonomuraea sp. NPDC046802]|uniref:hypothetical protein n=1 Tax=Nonomuraea sp. NPDC046802 TaxID=3154919 RepID=UPI0033E7489D